MDLLNIKLVFFVCLSVCLSVSEDGRPGDMSNETGSNEIPFEWRGVASNWDVLFILSQISGPDPTWILRSKEARPEWRHRPWNEAMTSRSSVTWTWAPDTSLWCSGFTTLMKMPMVSFVFLLGGGGGGGAGVGAGWWWIGKHRNPLYGNSAQPILEPLIRSFFLLPLVLHLLTALFTKSLAP